MLLWAAETAAGWTSSSSSSGEDSANDQQTALLVGLLSFICLCIAAVAAACHRRCQQRLAQLLFSANKPQPQPHSDTAGLNKTNSYKSSPSGRSIYSYNALCFSVVGLSVSMTGYRYIVYILRLITIWCVDQWETVSSSQGRSTLTCIDVW